MADAPTEVIPAIPADPDAPVPDMTAPEAPAPAAPAEDLSTQVADLESQLAELRAAARSGATVKMKVEDPHVAFVLGHIVVGTEYTDVPSSSVAALMEGAANSGVTLTQEEG
jgi:hypothetical protein